MKTTGTFSAQARPILVLAFALFGGTSCAPQEPCETTATCPSDDDPDAESPVLAPTGSLPASSTGDSPVGSTPSTQSTEVDRAGDGGAAPTNVASPGPTSATPSSTNVSGPLSMLPLIPSLPVESLDGGASPDADRVDASLGPDQPAFAGDSGMLPEPDDDPEQTDSDDASSDDSVGVCVAECSGKQCGDDGCGGDCGVGCANGQTCSALGQCVCTPGVFDESKFGEACFQ